MRLYVLPTVGMYHSDATAGNEDWMKTAALCVDAKQFMAPVESATTRQDQHTIGQLIGQHADGIHQQILST
jgi:hypothetical protein